MWRRSLLPVYGAMRAVVGAFHALEARTVRRGRPRLLIYTDSRGFRVEHWYSKKNPLGSYVGRLAREYQVGYSICPYSHTTLIDYLYDIRDRRTSDCVVIIHAGVVDFSPRPLSGAIAILAGKARRIEALFGCSSVAEFVPEVYEIPFEGELTASLYGPAVFKKYILPAINRSADRMIWIGANPVLEYWRGNYARSRPPNINVILDYQKIVDAEFRGSLVSLRGWSSVQVRRNTVDNIHLSADGMVDIFGAVKELLSEIAGVS